MSKRFNQVKKNTIVLSLILILLVPIFNDFCCGQPNNLNEKEERLVEIDITQYGLHRTDTTRVQLPIDMAKKLKEDLDSCKNTVDIFQTLRNLDIISDKDMNEKMREIHQIEQLKNNYQKNFSSFSEHKNIFSKKLSSNPHLVIHFNLLCEFVGYLVASYNLPIGTTLFFGIPNLFIWLWGLHPELIPCYDIMILISAKNIHYYTFDGLLGTLTDYDYMGMDDPLIAIMGFVGISCTYPFYCKGVNAYWGFAVAVFITGQKN